MLLRWAVTLIACLIPLAAFGQSPIAWSYYGPGLWDSKIHIDASGNIFWVGVRSGPGFQRVHVMKFTGSGDLLFENSVAFNTSDAEVEVLKPSVTSTRIYVGLKGNSSLVAAFETDNLAFRWAKALTDIRLNGVFGSAVQVVTVEENTTSAFVSRRSTVTGNVSGTTTLPSMNEVHESIADSSGHVYLAGSGATTNTSRLIRVNAAGSIHYDNAVAFIGYAMRLATSIAINPATQQVLIGYYAQITSQTASNALVFRASLSNGSGSTWTFDASVDDVISSILPQSDGSVVVAMHFWDLATSYGTRIIRRSSLGPIWTIDHTRAQSMSIAAAQDGSGNVVVSRTDPDTIYSDHVLEKRDVETGNLLWQHKSTNIAVGDLKVSATGSPIFCIHGYLYSTQGLIASFDRSTVIGGNPVQLQIQLTRPTPLANLPVLFFSNAAELPVPASVNLPLASTGTTLPINTLGVTATKVATVNVRHVGFITQKAVTLLPPVLSTLVVSPVQVTGGTSTQGTVTLAGDAPTGGWLVNLSSGNAAASVPATVTIPATLATAQFVISTNPVSANTGIVISASKNSVTRTAFMAVNAPALSTFTLGSSSVVGGQNGSLTVTLNANAPTGGSSISLVSGAPSLVVLPSSTAVPAATNTRNLAFTTADVTASINVTLIAYRGNVVRTQTLTLTP